LEAFAGNPKLVGIRHIAQSEPDDRFLLQPEFLRGISLLGEFDLAYDILIYPKHLPVAAEFVRRFPRQRFVLDHLAKPPIRAETSAPGNAGCGAGDISERLLQIVGLVTEDDWQNWKLGILLHI
jgi:L-fuconolactonase